MSRSDPMIPLAKKRNSFLPASHRPGNIQQTNSGQISHLALGAVIWLGSMLLSMPTLAQVSSDDPGKKWVDSTQLLIEFEIVREAVKSLHPSAFAYLSETEYDSLSQAAKKEIGNGMNSQDFHLLVRRFLQHLKCGHLAALPSLDWYAYHRASPRLLPIQVIILQDQLYLKSALDPASPLLPGWKILSIDQLSSQEILAQMKSIQERDGLSNTFEHQKMQSLFRTYYLFLYGPKDFYEIEYLNAQNQLERIQAPATFPSSTTKPLPASAPQPLLKMKAARFFRSEEMPELAVLDINGFSSKGYKKFYRAVFKEIDQTNLQHLVIDLRNNGGGYFPHGNHLLTYLLEERFAMSFHRPKTHRRKPTHAKMPVSARFTKALFSSMPDQDKEDPRRNYAIKYKPKKKHPYRGNLYVLTNGGSFSMGSLVAAQLKHGTDAILIGEETGGGEAGSNAILIYHLTLPESRIRVQIPYYALDHQVDPEMWGRGVMPAIAIPYTLEEILDGKDKEMEAIQELLRQ